MTATGSITRDTANDLARKAIRKEFPTTTSGVTSCRIQSSVKATCKARWKALGRRFDGTVSLAVASSGSTNYAIKATGKRKGLRAQRVSRRGVIARSTPPKTFFTRPTGASRDNPIPRGQTGYPAKGDWEIKVIGTTPDATAQVLAENQFNDPPAAGRQFFMARVRAKYLGSGSDKFDSTFRLRAVGASAVEYTTFDNSCGVIPNAMPDPEVFPGGTIEGNVCWSVLSTDVGSLLMADKPLLVDDRVWFGL